MLPSTRNVLLLAVLIACIQSVLADPQSNGGMQQGGCPSWMSQCRKRGGRRHGGGGRNQNNGGGQSNNNGGGQSIGGGTPSDNGGSSTATSDTGSSEAQTTDVGNSATNGGSTGGSSAPASGNNGGSSAPTGGSTGTNTGSGGNSAAPAPTGTTSGNSNNGGTSTGGAATTGTQPAQGGSTGNTPITDAVPSGSSTGSLVFAHYMMLGTPPDGKYSTDINAAKSAGIDAFALNFGGWGNDFSTWEGYMKNMFDACATAGFKAFISFDLTSVTDPNMIVRLMKQYISHPALLYYKDRPVYSSFANNDPPFDFVSQVLTPVKTATGKQVYFLPGTTQTGASKIFGANYADAVFTWLHPDASPSGEANNDKAFSAASASSGKAWCVGIAPWFFKHYTQYNWGNHQDSQIFVDRFKNVMNLAHKPDFIEFITWNDFGESSYFGQPNSGKYSPSVDPAGQWATLDHSGFLAMAARMTRMFKMNINPNTAAASSIVDKEDVYIYYRTQPWNTPGTNDPIGIPNVSPAPADKVFVVSFLKSAATITVTVGGKSTTIQATAGLQQYSVPMAQGSVSMKAERSGTTIASKSPSAQIKASNAIYNGNVVAV